MFRLINTDSLFLCTLGETSTSYTNGSSHKEWRELKEVKFAICKRDCHAGYEIYTDVLRKTKYYFWKDVINSPITVGYVQPITLKKQYISRKELYALWEHINSKTTKNKNK